MRKVVKKAVNALGFDVVKVSKKPTIPPFDWLKQYDIKTFIDIGAHVGEFVDFANSLWPQAQVYAFEPLKSVYEGLYQKTAHRNNVQVFNLALGEKKESVPLYHNEFAPSSSLLPMERLHTESFPQTKSFSVEHAQVVPLDIVFENEKLAKDIFIKIDTQGYEDRVIAGGTKTLATAKILLIEVSFERLYTGQKLFHEIYSQLHQLGYEFKGIKNQVLRPSDGAILQAHAYFIRR